MCVAESSEISRSHRMKTSLAAVVLALGAAVAASGQTTASQPQAQPATPAAQPGAPQAPPQQKKEIKDPAEYNAYVGAVQQQDPAAKISGLEAFLTQYPNSVMKQDALEILMGAYQQTGNQQKMMDTAQKLLQADPNNVRALALLTYTLRAKALQGGPTAQQDLAQAKQYGEKGLQALPNFNKPEGMSDNDFQKLKDQMSVIFNSAVGQGALQEKDYATATKSLRAAVTANPNDFSLVYPLALAYLQSTPPDSLNGIWYATRASLVAPAQYQAQIGKYAKSQYVKYHGGEDGWTEVEAQAKASPNPPAGFNIKPAPTPSEQAANLINGKTPDDVKKLSFAEWELVLSAGDQSAQDKVWTVIKGVPLQMEGTVLKASPTELQIAASQDDIDQKRADIVLTMNAAIPARLMPKEGATLDFEGTPASYTPSPFVMTMEKGQLLTKAAPPTRRPPARRRPSQ
jgi:hypothetical protein